MSLRNQFFHSFPMRYLVSCENLAIHWVGVNPLCLYARPAFAPYEFTGRNIHFCDH